MLGSLKWPRNCLGADSPRFQTSGRKNLIPIHSVFAHSSLPQMSNTVSKIQFCLRSWNGMHLHLPCLREAVQYHAAVLCGARCSLQLLQTWDPALTQTCIFGPVFSSHCIYLHGGRAAVATHLRSDLDVVEGSPTDQLKTYDWTKGLQSQTQQ